MMQFLLPLAAATTLLAAAPRAAADPAAVAPPPDARLLLRTTAEGVQIYTCAGQGSGVAWTLKAPEAVLHDGGGKAVAKHFAGPSWQANDGSTVIGDVIARTDAPTGKAIPWLLLRAKSHSGAGEFADVAFIQRIDTAGGVAPDTGCDTGTRGNEVRVPYSAAYLFYAVR